MSKPRDEFVDRTDEAPPPGMLPDGTLNVVEEGPPSHEDVEVDDLNDYDELFGIGAGAETKKEQNEVGYVGPDGDRPNGQRCEKCTMFVRAAEDASDPGTCTAVNGPIDPAGWCELYKAESENVGGLQEE